MNPRRNAWPLPRSTVAPPPPPWSPGPCSGPGLRAQPAQPRRLTPAQTEGPFYPVSFPKDSDFDLLRNGALDYRRGQPAWVEGTVTDPQGRPVAGAQVEIWQCDEAGHYHHPGDRGSADPAFQGFGRVTVGADGSYRFRTIRPAPYSGRTPHIHVKVKLGAARAVDHPAVRRRRPAQRARLPLAAARRAGPRRGHRAVRSRRATACARASPSWWRPDGPPATMRA